MSNSTTPIIHSRTTPSRARSKTFTSSRETGLSSSKENIDTNIHSAAGILRSSTPPSQLSNFDFFSPTESFSTPDEQNATLVAPAEFARQLQGKLLDLALATGCLTKAKKLYIQWSSSDELTQQESNVLLSQIESLLLRAIDVSEATSLELAQAQYYLGYIYFTIGILIGDTQSIKNGVENFRALDPNVFAKVSSELPNLHHIDQLTLIQIDIDDQEIAPAWQNIMKNPQMRQALVSSDPSVNPVQVIESIARELLSWATAKCLISEYGDTFDIDDIYDHLTVYPEFEPAIQTLRAIQLEEIIGSKTKAPTHDGLFAPTFRRSQSMPELRSLAMAEEAEVETPKLVQ